MTSFEVRVIGKVELPLTISNRPLCKPTKVHPRPGWFSNRRCFKVSGASGPAIRLSSSRGSIARVGTF